MKKNFLVRVEHFFEMNEDANYSHPITFDLQTIFQTIGTISTTVEMTLGANLALADLKRLDWVTSEDQSSHMDIPKERELKDTNITLNPMQIRTFQVTVA